jgi:hypothetical protein
MGAAASGVAAQGVPIVVVLQWRCSGVAVVLQWCCSGVAVVLQWCCSGIAVVLKLKKLQFSEVFSIVPKLDVLSRLGN